MKLHHRLAWPFMSGEKYFGRGVAPEHLRIGSDGSVKIRLTGDWTEFVRSLPSLDEVVTTTTNHAVSLVQTNRYPEFKFCPCGKSACSVDCGLGFHFPAWSEVWAWRQYQEDGLWHMLCVHGPDGRTNHQIVLHPSAGEENFRRLVEQFCPQSPGMVPLLTPSRRSLETPDSCNRLEWFRERKFSFVENPQNGCRRIHRESFADLWQNVMAERLRLGTTVVTAPVLQSLSWQPLAFKIQAGGFSASSDEVLFQCQLKALAELWVVPLSSAENAPLALEAYDADDNLLFSLAAPAERASTWVEMLAWLPAAKD